MVVLIVLWPPPPSREASQPHPECTGFLGPMANLMELRAPGEADRLSTEPSLGAEEWQQQREMLLKCPLRRGPCRGLQGYMLQTCGQFTGPLAINIFFTHPPAFTVAPALACFSLLTALPSLSCQPTLAHFLLAHLPSVSQEKPVKATFR